MEQREPADLVQPSAPDTTYHDAVARTLQSRRTELSLALTQLSSHSTSLAEAAALLIGVLRSGHKILVAGNGGSAAEAQHFVAELVGRFRRDRTPYAALALTTDSSIVTAIANDYGYEHVFARQVFALGQSGDLLIAFSTSGESENLVRAAVAARQRRMAVVAVTGNRPCRLERLADLTIWTPADDPAAAQELHMIVTHILCDIAESELSGEAGNV